MRFRITLLTGLMLILSMTAIAVFAPAQAQARNITSHDCLMYARHHHPHEHAAYERCMQWAILHNVCHGAPHCQGWLLVAICESGDSVESLTKGNIASIRWGYLGPEQGGLQFNPGTWDSLHTGYADAFDAPPSVQIRGAEHWRHEIGGNPHQNAGWPHCGAFWF